MTTESSSSSKAGDVPDNRPLLEYKETIFKDLKVRLHAKHKKGNIQRLYDFCSDWGMDVLEKQREFAAQGWVQMAGHLRPELVKRFRLKRVRE